MTPLRVGIAGYGVVGQRRRHFIDRHPRLKTVALSDAKLRRDGVQPDGTAAYADFHRLIDRETLDVLFVCLPNNLAPEATILGLKRGLHVFCEKPPGRDVADIRRVRAVERARPKQRLMYGFNHRYHDSVKDALRLIRSGKLGKILNLNGVYGKSKVIPFAGGWRARRAQAGGGILLDQGIHMVDLMRLFAGEFTEVHAIISNSYWKHDVEDNAYVLMKTRAGVVALLHSSATLWRHRFNLDVTLERGNITLAGLLTGSKSYGAETMTVTMKSKDDAGDPREVTTRYNQDPSWREEIDAFADAILKKKPLAHGSSQEALRTMELIYTIYCADPRWKRRFNLRHP